MLQRAEYVALEVRGERASHVVAFARRDGPHWVVAVATRLYVSLGAKPGAWPAGDVWGDTAIVWPEPLPEDGPAWLEDAISGRHFAPRGGMLPLADLLRDFPTAALSGTAPQAN